MLSILLFVSGGEIFIILIFILMFFGADKIPEFARMMGKGAREFKKATDDIKREIHESSSGAFDEVRNIGNSLTDSLTKEISEPVQKTVNETAKSFNEFKDQHYEDIYYNSLDSEFKFENEYKSEYETNVGADSQDSTLEPEQQDHNGEAANLEIQNQDDDAHVSETLNPYEHD